MTGKIEYDIIVVGGGIVGGIFAALAAHSGFKIAIVEASEISPETDRPDPRVFAITRASEQVFRAAGIWDPIASKNLGYFREMKVWDANGAGSLHFDSQQICEHTLGYIIENQHIQHALTTALNGQANIHWERPAKVETLTTNDHFAEITLDNGKTISSRLIVGADGANSKIRSLAGFSNTLHNYQQTALICSVKTQQAHFDIARQRFLETGPLAFLPLAEPHTCSIVWSTTPEQAAEMQKADISDFHFQLGQAFGSALGEILESTQRYTFPLVGAHTQPYVTDRIAVIGDAAHRIHPLAGQGANIGILDAASLAQVICDHSDKDVGQKQILRKYERWRKGENLSMKLAMESLKYSFGSEFPPVKHLRNAGMDLVNHTPCLKRIIMHRAMGLEGDLPRVALTPSSL